MCDDLDAADSLLERAAAESRVARAVPSEARSLHDRAEVLVNVLNNVLSACSFSTSDGGATYEGSFRLTGYDGPLSQNPNEAGWVGVAVLTVTVDAYIG